MGSSLRWFRRFLKNDDGPTAVEYAVMLCLIVVAGMTAISSLASVTSSLFNNAAVAINPPAATQTGTSRSVAAAPAEASTSSVTTELSR